MMANVQLADDFRCFGADQYDLVGITSQQPSDDRRADINVDIDVCEIEKILSTYQGHGLNDLNKANLMSRVDSKFILPVHLLPHILQKMRDQYSVLDINKNRISKYLNRYYDTSDMDFYRDHHNGKLNRFKVRHRTYVDTDTQFLEIKFKNNKKRTIKKRIQVEDISCQKSICDPFVRSVLGQSFDDLLVIQRSGYRRVALAAEERSERLTLDLGLWYGRSDSEKCIAPPGFFIAELKQNKRNIHSPFYRLMLSYGFHPTSFSKYCIGCALVLGNKIKTNAFKPVLSKIDDLADTV